jgi:hypothetical protein
MLNPPLEIIKKLTNFQLFAFLAGEEEERVS